MTKMPLILPKVHDDLKASPRRSQSCYQCVIKVQDMMYYVSAPPPGREPNPFIRMKELQEDDEKHTLH